MEWVPLPEYAASINLDDKPRPLTEQEIAYVVSHLPFAPSADSTAADITRKSVMSWLASALREKPMAPSAIPDLIARIVDQHNKSLVVPGTPVGITAAEALGATTTQMTLNSVAFWEELLILVDDNTKHVKIGEWIDSLLAQTPDKIQHIPENRTQYLELSQPVKILTTDKNGNVTWENVTAATKHLPVGDLVNVTTKSGRSVTATQAKSFLIWNNELQRLVEINGSDIKIGDCLPVTLKVPSEHDDDDSKLFGDYYCRSIGHYLAEAPTFDSYVEISDYTHNILKKNISSNDLLLHSKYNIGPTLYGCFEYCGEIQSTCIRLKPKNSSKSLIDFLSFLCSRLGIFTQYDNDMTELVISDTQSILNWMINVDIHNDSESDVHHYDVYNILKKSENIKTLNNVVLDPIVSIEMLPYTEYVYDLTVPSTLNFSLWNGLNLRDTFHSSGSAKSATFGIEAMRDLIFARQNPKNESCTIYFTNKSLTYEQVLDLRRYIVGSVVSDFITDYDIDSPEILSKFWWHTHGPDLLKKQVPRSTQVLRLFLNKSEMFKHKVTIGELANVLEKDVPPSIVAVYGPISDGIIDLYPNPSFIDDTLRTVAKNFQIPSSLAELTYLESCVYPELNNIRVKGISGIKQLYPKVDPVWSMVILEKPVSLADFDLIPKEAEPIKSQIRPFVKERSKVWALYYNPSVMRLTGLEPGNLSALCKQAGLEIINPSFPDRLLVLMPPDRFRSSDGSKVSLFNNNYYQDVTSRVLLLDGVYYLEHSPDASPENSVNIDGKTYQQIDKNTLLVQENQVYRQLTKFENLTEIKPNDYVNEKVALAKKAHQAEIKRLTDENLKKAQLLPEEQRKALIKKTVQIPRPEIVKAAEFIIAETDGANLKDLLALPGVDKTRTTCNNMHTITATLGIEAARTFIIRALNNTIASTGSYIHPANITFIAEFITSRGNPYGATYTGISRQPGGHLSLATLERAGKVFTQNALHGRKEDIRNVSASVAVGARMAIGTGYFDIGQDFEDRPVVNDELFTAISKTRKNSDQNDHAEDQDILGGLALGNTFDNFGEEGETNLRTLFTAQDYINPEIVPEPTTRDRPNRPVVRRSNQQVDESFFVGVDQLKFGFPVDDKIETERNRVAIRPVLSEGLVAENLQTGPSLQQQLPRGLLDLLQLTPQEPQEQLDTQPEPEIIPSDHPMTQNVPLPTEQVDELPGLEDFTVGDKIMIRQEEVRDLQRMDPSAAAKAFQ